jgi:hypothetical protein
MAGGNSSFAATQLCNHGFQNDTIQNGWVSSPNVRGTFEILWSSVFTMCLASWSILCLNVPSRTDSKWRQWWRKFLWTMLAVMGPEVVCQRAFGDWLVAREWKREFRILQRDDWTMSHSFFANMGGVLLNDGQYTFPVNAAQLYFLDSNQYIDYPIVSREVIVDKDKAGWLMRSLTLGQTLWFLINCIGRVMQGLPLTTLELSTLAFIPPAAGTFFFWFNKPMDAIHPITITLRDGVTISKIRREFGQADDDSWIKTPLDFTDKEREWPWNIYWQYGLVWLEKKVGLGWLVLNPKEKPINHIPDDYWPKPTFRALPILLVFHLSYCIPFLFGWNFHLPTSTEILLWRIASVIQPATIISAWLTMPWQLDEKSKVTEFFNLCLGKVGLCSSSNLQAPRKTYWWDRFRPSDDCLERWRTMASEHPHWRVSVKLLFIYPVTWVIYLLARLYIVAEDFASLRRMPSGAYQSISWGKFVRHS